MNRHVMFASVMMLAGALSVSAQTSPFSADTKRDYTSIRDILLRSAAKMPEEGYSFKATPQERTYGEMIAHIADVQTTLCAITKKEDKKGDASGKVSKADLSAALKASFDYCDPVYNSLTDITGAEIVKMFGNNRSKLGVLSFNIAHDNEMYGQMVCTCGSKALCLHQVKANPRVHRKRF